MSVWQIAIMILLAALVWIAALIRIVALIRREKKRNDAALSALCRRVEAIERTSDTIVPVVKEHSEKLKEIPVEELRHLYDQEAAFNEGLNNILNYSLTGYGLTREEQTHEP